MRKWDPQNYHIKLEPTNKQAFKVQTSGLRFWFARKRVHNGTFQPKQQSCR